MRVSISHARVREGKHPTLKTVPLEENYLIQNTSSVPVEKPSKKT